MTPNEQSHGPVSLSRAELYEQVWATPIVQLAKRYGLSDVGLAKACKRHRIPRPSLGYWAKQAVGKAPSRPPLPTVADPRLQVVVLAQQPKRAPKPVLPGDTPEPIAPPRSFRDPEIVALWERFCLEFPELRVPAALRSPLPVVATTLSALKRSVQERRRYTPAVRDETYSPRSADGKPCLNVCVGRDRFERAMRFMDTLLKTFSVCGFQLRLDRDTYSHDTRLDALGERFRLRLSEPEKKVPHTPTAEDLEALEKYGKRIPKTHSEPGGQFCLTLSGDLVNQPIRSWSDGAVRLVDEMIPEIVRGILEHVEDMRARKEASARVARQQAVEAQRRHQEEQRRKEAQARVDSMILEVEAWERAGRVRRYLRALQRTALQQNGRIDPGSEMDRWLDWAHAVADRIDPLTPYRQAPPAAPEPSIPVAPHSAERAPGRV